MTRHTIRTLDLRTLASEYDALRDADDRDEEEEERYQSLVALEKQVGGDLYDYAQDFPTAIYEGDFVEYAKEYAEETETGSTSNCWPYCFIDWKAAAEDLITEFTQIEFEGETYLIQDA